MTQIESVLDCSFITSVGYISANDTVGFTRINLRSSSFVSNCETFSADELVTVDLRGSPQVQVCHLLETCGSEKYKFFHNANCILEEGIMVLISLSHLRFFRF